MENITAEQLEILLLTKAMSDNIGRVERWSCLEDVEDEQIQALQALIKIMKNE